MEDRIIKERRIGNDVYTITVDSRGHNITLYQNDEMLLTSMSLSKVDRYYNELISLIG